MGTDNSATVILSIIAPTEFKTEQSHCKMSSQLNSIYVSK